MSNSKMTDVDSYPLSLELLSRRNGSPTSIERVQPLTIQSLDDALMIGSSRASNFWVRVS